MKLVNQLLFAVIALCISISTLAKEPSNPDLSAKEDKYLNQQATYLLGLAGDTLGKFTPAIPEPLERRLALSILDGVLHDVYAPDRAPVQEFFHERMEQAIDMIKAAKINEGAKIWKLYNHAFIVRTATVTIAFDLTRAGLSENNGFILPDALITRLINECDVLFISHKHGDHADEVVANTFLAQGKPVVAPPEIWTNKDIHRKIIHLTREAHTKQSLMIGTNQHNLEIVVYPGHQGKVTENNVPLIITPEGLSFAHFGDQRNIDDFSWIDRVKDNFKVDVAFPNSWTHDIVRVINGFAPKLVITGHENELGHTIDHREPYWITYQRKKGSNYRGGNELVGYDAPLLIMTWGESYHYIPEK